MKVSLTWLAIATAVASLLFGANASAGVPYSFSDLPSQEGRCIGDQGVGEIDRSEKTCLAQVGELAQRVGPGLQLKFRNGKTRIYLNEEAKCQSDGADDCVKYQLTGYFPEHDLILIEVDYWEGASWLLVRADTGDGIAIVAPPHYSPDRRWLVSVASSVGPAGPPNGMDIVPSVSNPSLKEWHYRTPDDGQWLYEFAGWEGNTRVKLLASSLSEPQRWVSCSVERRNGEWHLREPR
ncbi:hypothetical protein TSA1_15900 [Bradyrhizobium nitroreducens]|uniref:Uncharacterized protein n=1 Tax=Bradyrhizobium nitroreducens TaxID=709803 RepID=A0A2M6UBZ9_9BRAD|nr:hypothetical protein [Bradyrhizobium nitroreducens]PIT02077.1 hypothetical protein TSA1_15900 [Bradyrhizobium nitroreducens]